MNLKSITEIIEKAKPNAKTTTINNYASNLKALMKIFEEGDLNFLTKFKEVEEKLSKKHYTSRRNYYNSIIVYLQALGKHKNVLADYIDMRDDLNEQYQKEQSTGLISEKQKPNFITFEELMEGIKRMEVELRGFKKDQKIKEKQKKMMLLQIYMIFQIHARLPMRNDLAGMEAIKKGDYNKLTDAEKKKTNWLVIEKNKLFMSLNQYKTNAKYKEIKFIVPKDLEKLLRAYLRINGTGVLFKTATGNPITRNVLSQLLLKYSKKYMEGKKISSTMLRKIVLSDKFGESNKEQEQMAKIAGHSVATMNDVYIKDKD